MDTAHLDYACRCFHYSRTITPKRWRANWETAMWRHLFWAIESGERVEDFLSRHGG